MYLATAVMVIVILVVAAAVGLYLNSRSTSINTATTGSGSKVIRVVAAENFWGSLISQLGGTHVSVTSIVSDPNTDPHQYESNHSNAISVANANLVIVNGAGYDTWALSLIAASNTQGQVVVLGVVYIR